MDITNIILVRKNYYGHLELQFSNPFWKENDCTRNVFIKTESYCDKGFGVCRASTTFNHLKFSNNQKLFKENNQKCSLYNPKLNFFPPHSSFENCNFTASLLTNITGYPLIDYTERKQTGLLIEPLKVIAEALKLNLTLLKASQKIQAEFYLSNGSLFKYILDRKIDTYVIFGWRTLPIYRDLDPTDIFFYDEAFWIVPRAGPISSFKVLMSIFTWGIWISILSSLMVVSLIFYFVGTFVNDQFVTSFLGSCQTIYLMTICAGFTKTPKTQVLRFISFSYAIYSLHIAYYFQGKLISSLTKPHFGPGVRNFEELLQSPLQPLMSLSNLDALKKANDSRAEVLKQKVLPLKMPVSMRVAFVAENKNVSMPIYTAYLNVDQNLKEKIKAIGDNFVFNMEATYILRKGHPFLESFNLIINRILESGLQVKWRKDVERRKFLINNNKPMKVLTMNILLGPFYILGFGYILGGSILIIENLIKYFLSI